MSIRRTFHNVLVGDLAAARDFYVGFLGLVVKFSSDWFIHVAIPDAPDLELGLFRADHELVPEAWRGAPRGGMLTVVVDDVNEVFEAAKSQGVPIVEPPRDLFFGQRRMLLRDPDGTLVDISSECPPDPAWMARVRDLGDGVFEESPTDA